MSTTLRSNNLHTIARSIFATAMQAVDVRSEVAGQIVVRDETLTLAGRSIARCDLDRVVVIAMGKAAVPMYQSAMQQLAGIATQAVVVAPAATLPAQNADFLPGSHPSPDERSAVAAAAVLALLCSVGPRDAVLFLISGGASAMVEQPLDANISLDDTAAFHRALVASGKPIAAMNTLRKHFSAVKGGRLAVAAAAAAMQCTLLVSDAPTCAPDAIASGPSLPDTTTMADCNRLLAELGHTLPRSVHNFFVDPLMRETPKPRDAAFTRAHWQVILSSDHLAWAALHAAQAHGFHSVIDNACDEWEYRDAALYLLDRSATLAREHPRSCVISVGEVSVTLSDNAGEGGRNQQFALWCADELARRSQRVTILSAGSDGIDGHSTAAGGTISETTAARAAAIGLSTQDALQRFNTAPLLQALGDDITIGPTGNNLRDLRLLLTE